MLLKNSSRRHARLDLGSARRTCHQNEFFNNLLVC